MKYIFCFVLLTILVNFSKAQQKQYLGAPKTEILVKGSFSVDSFSRLPLDTLVSAPTGSLAQKSGVLYQKDGIWKAVGSVANTLVKGDSINYYYPLHSNPKNYVDTAALNLKLDKSDTSLFITHILSAIDTNKTITIGGVTKKISTNPVYTVHFAPGYKTSVSGNPFDVNDPLRVNFMDNDTSAASNVANKQSYSDTATWDATKSWVRNQNYLNSFTETDPIFNAHTVKNITNGTGFLKNAAGVWSYDNNSYALTTHNHTGTYEPVITAGTTAQYWRGDKSWQTLNTSAVPESGNLYYTDVRARASISLTTTGTSGAATYNSTTGVLNIPNYTTSSSALSSITAATATNTINNSSYQQEWQWNSIAASGTGFKLSSSSIGAGGFLFNSSVSGTGTGNAGSLQVNNTRTGGSDNYGVYTSSSGGATNYGSVSIGTGGTTAVGILARASGGTNNYAIHTDMGQLKFAGLNTSADNATYMPMAMDAVGNVVKMTSWPGGGGSGSVTSVGLSLPSFFTVSGSPVTTTGTLTATLASQAANTHFAAPDGAAGTPTFRALVNNDLPVIIDAKISSASTWNAKQAALVSGTNIKTINGNSLLGSGDLTISGGSGSPAGANTQVQFNSSGAFGASANLVWDNANKRLGVGLSSPSRTVDVSFASNVNFPGAGSDGMFFNNTGTGDNTFVFATAQTGGNPQLSFFRQMVGGWMIGMDVRSGTGNFRISSKWDDFTQSRISITTAGKIGLNNSSPTYDLDATGTVRLQSLSTSTDFVNTVPLGRNTSTNEIVAMGSWGVTQTYQTLTDAATITYNAATSVNATVTIAGARTLSITNATNGMKGTLIVKQDATGSRTLTLPAGSKVVDGGGGTITLTTTPNAIDILSWTFDGANYYFTYGTNYN